MSAPALLLGLALLVLALPREGSLLLDRTGLGPAAHRVLVVPLVACAAGVLLLLRPGLLVPAALVLGAVPVVRRARAARARASVDEVERRRAGEACDALATELRAGRGTVDALEQASLVAGGPSARLLAEAASTARLGGDVCAVLRRPSGSAVPGLLLGLAACWQVCARSGSGLAGAVERLADGARAQEEQHRAVEAALAGPRATAGLLAVLPLAGIGLAAALGADPLHVLLRTPAGLVCLVLGVGLDALGLLWTRRLVAGATR